MKRDRLTMGQIVDSGVRRFVYTDRRGGEWVLEVDDSDGVRLDGEQ